jgi:glutamyl/glutaminyl-tRNA synthetase
MVVTRFAPSPTGSLHVGGARTALFNWLWARHNNGKFILRIEDTDRKRHQEEAIEAIIEDLQWLGLDWDTDVERQSQRLHVYNAYINALLLNDLAYRKSDTNAVFLGVPHKQTITINDTIAGNVTISTKGMKNFVIRKSDGFPTYNFACVIDDYEMRVTHVIRGKEHLNNCIPQQLIRDALEIEECPVYSHVSVILNMDGSKMSKRNTNKVTVKEYRDSGISPDALLNYLALLGWSIGGDKELASKDELIKLFTLDRLRKSNSKFDETKLNAFNRKYRNK